ncbi:MAG TPA: hypothetical protein VNO52_00310 [Methylomirabilota bacterium]|nr:hypothetical protein [Methylomirabilota bacterium]
MPNEIKAKFGTTTVLPIALASLASSTSGVGVQSDMVDNETPRWQRIHVFFKVTTGTGPTANKSIRFFLLKCDDVETHNILTDGASQAGGTITIETADQVYSVITSSASDKTYQGSFVIENPGPQWGIAVVQDTGVALNATATTHELRWVGENPEVQ